MAEVADVLGFKASTVYRWAKMYAEGGLEALEGRKAVGKPPKLTLTQVTRLRALIVGVDPRQLRFEFALWTREMVGELIGREFGELIGREFGVVMSPSAVGRLLRRVGLSPQRLLWRAYQANPDAVERWKAEEFPAIRAEPPVSVGWCSSKTRRRCALTTTAGPPGGRSGTRRWLPRPGPAIANGSWPTTPTGRCSWCVTAIRLTGRSGPRSGCSRWAAA